MRRLDGALAWPELAGLIGGARVYIGPDTSVTHLAATTGVPVVALYGPTDPRLYGPWPARGLGQPMGGRRNCPEPRQCLAGAEPAVLPMVCLPCQQEGCERRLDSHSQCLDELSVSQVLSAVDAALSAAPAGRRYGGA